MIHHEYQIHDHLLTQKTSMYCIGISILILKKIFVPIISIKKSILYLSIRYFQFTIQKLKITFKILD